MRISTASFFLTVYLVTLVLGSSALANKKGRTVPDLSERFAFTTQPQDAVFFIGIHWTGGMGGMPILDIDKTRPKSMEGLPIFFDAAREKEVQEKLPACVRGTPLIKVTARIQLVRKSGRNASIEEAPVQSYYEAMASSISDIDVWAKACGN